MIALHTRGDPTGVSAFINNSQITQTHIHYTMVQKVLHFLQGLLNIQCLHIEVENSRTFSIFCESGNLVQVDEDFVVVCTCQLNRLHIFRFFETKITLLSIHNTLKMRILRICSLSDKSCKKAMESSRKGQLFDRVFSVIFKGVGVLKGRFSEKYGQTLPNKQQ